MEITREQFTALAPAASPATVDALFAATLPGDYAEGIINFILTDNGLSEPAALVQFLAACHLATDGFTNFDKPFTGLAPDVWLAQRARQWTKEGLAMGAELWNWEQTAWDAAWLFDWPTFTFLKINNTIDGVCKALEIKNRCEAGARLAGMKAMANSPAEDEPESDGYDMQ
jgi:hypothetical protein